MSDSSTIPSAAALAERYKTARVLRTRATGTPFRVRSVTGRLVVTTTSGSDRDITPDEIIKCWPYVERAAPKNAWKHLSNNSSYLESIYDDLRSQSAASPAAHLPLPGVPIDATSPAASSHDSLAREAERLSSDVTRLQRELLAAQTVAQKTNVAYEDLLVRESRLGRELDLGKNAGDRLRSELAGALEDRSRLQAAFTAARNGVAGPGPNGTATEISRLRATNQSLVTDLATSRRLLGEARKVATEIEPLREAKAGAARQATDAKRKLEAVKVELSEAQQEAAEAKRSLEAERKARRLASASAVAASTPTTMEVLIDAGKLRFSKDFVVDRSTSTHLVSAASQIFTNPNAAVADCRRRLSGRSSSSGPRQRAELMTGS